MVVQARRGAAVKQAEEEEVVERIEEKELHQEASESYLAVGGSQVTGHTWQGVV